MLIQKLNVCLFGHQIFSVGGQSVLSHWFFLSVLDPQTVRHCLLSVISLKLVNFFGSLVTNIMKFDIFNKKFACVFKIIAKIDTNNDQRSVNLD